jgi:alanine racemase
VSYGAAHILSRDSRIAVCGIGYADGFHRSASGAGVPLRSATPDGPRAQSFDGKRVPVIGKITMDLTMFDVTDLPEDAVAAGSWMELFGPTIPLRGSGHRRGHVSYEMLTSLGQRYTRGIMSAEPAIAPGPAELN